MTHIAKLSIHRIFFFKSYINIIILSKPFPESLQVPLLLSLFNNLSSPALQ